MDTIFGDSAHEILPGLWVGDAESAPMAIARDFAVLNVLANAGTSPRRGRGEAEYPYSGADPEEVIGGLTPRPPMCRPYIDPLGGFCFDPPAEDPSAGEHERVRPVVVDDG
jgi:hypothetical protein